MKGREWYKLGVFMEAGGRMVWGGNEEDPHTSKPHSMKWEENRQDLRELKGKQHPQISFINAQDYARPR